MKAAIEPVVKDLVLVGGGHTHAIALRMFGMKPTPGLRLTLITDTSESAYSGMLPGRVANLYSDQECQINLHGLADFAGAQLYLDRAIGLDLAAKRVICSRRPPVAFDLLSIDIGSTPKLPNDFEHLDGVIPAKPIPHFLRQWDAIVDRVRQHPENPLCLAIVGGGAGGVELVLNMQRCLHDILQAAGQPSINLEIHLIHRGGQLVPQFNPGVRDRLHALLIQRSIILHLNEEVQTVKSGYIRCGSGFELHPDTIIWVTQATPPDWLHKSGLATDDRGFVLVNDALQSLSHPCVFAAGDVATMLNYPRPKAGVFAVRQGKPLVHNLRRSLQNIPLKPYHPPQRYLSLLGTADDSAIAVWGQFSWRSPLLWRLKQWIDLRFMRKMNELPDMKQKLGIRNLGTGKTGQRTEDVWAKGKEKEDSSFIPRPSSLIPHPSPTPCAGCGSKVGSTVLTLVLQRLQQDSSTPHSPLPTPHVLLGLDSPDDAAVLQVPDGKVLVQTIDHFTTLINDPFVFGQIGANHALSDLFAMGATPHSALAIATVPYGTEAKVEESLYQLLSGALQVLHQAGATLIGGHTTEGSELAFGLSCNGWADATRLLRKSGMGVGQALILTKPLGTGTLFAARMRRRVRGAWIDAAVETMLRSNGQAAQCLLNYGVTACTDITGFGLVGHLAEMIRASHVAVELNLDAIPVLPGAQETVEMGIVSSLQPQNLRASQFVQNLDQVCHHPKFQLLFDPQTSGGLLASIPAEQASSCVAKLKALGYPESTIVGHTTTWENEQPIAIV